MPPIDTLFGTGQDLTPMQMAARAIALFFITLLLIRISGRRSFAQRTPFDACTTVLIGATLARAVVGASPFGATVAAAFAIVVTHRLVGLACVRWRSVETLVNGREIELMHDGRLDGGAMRRALVTRHNVEEAIRKSNGGQDVHSIERAVVERNGDITVVPRAK